MEYCRRIRPLILEVNEIEEEGRCAVIYSFIVVGCETSDTEQCSRQDDPEELIEVIVNYMNEGDELDIFTSNSRSFCLTKQRADYVVATNFFEK